MHWRLKRPLDGDREVAVYRVGDVRHVFASAALAADRLGFRRAQDFPAGMAELANEHRMNLVLDTPAPPPAAGTLGP